MFGFVVLGSKRYRELLDKVRQAELDSKVLVRREALVAESKLRAQELWDRFHGTAACNRLWMDTHREVVKAGKEASEAVGHADAAVEAFVNQVENNFGVGNG